MTEPENMEQHLDAQLEDVIGQLGMSMESLFAGASILADEYNQFIRKRNPKLDWPDKSSLQLRVRQRGLSMTAEWYQVRWYGSKAKGTRKPFSTYIAKPKTGYGYTMSKLFVYAQDWEKDKLQDIEARLTAIRRQAKFVMKAIAALKDTVPDPKKKQGEGA